MHDAKAALTEAQIVVAGTATPALAAAEPGIDNAPVADLDAVRVGPEFDDLPENLVADRARQGHAAFGKLHALAAAKLVIAFPEVQVGMTNAAMRHREQDFGAHGFRRRLLNPDKRQTMLRDGPGFHSILSVAM